MTDIDLLEADCIHGNIWYKCKECTVASTLDGCIACDTLTAEDLKSKFNVGDRLRSLVSDEIWIVVQPAIDPPKIYEGCIPVRKTFWPTNKFCWQPPDKFEKAY